MEENKKSIDMQKVYYIFLIFIIGSICGWIYEEVFYRITEGMFRNRGILYGPWLPIYGIGGIIIYKLKPLKIHPIIVFLLATIGSGVLEYIIGYIDLRFFDERLWDYRGLFLNIDGFVCLRSVLSFGLMGVGLIYFIEPILDIVISNVKPKSTRNVCIFLAIVFVIDCIVSHFLRTPITY